MKVSEIHVSVRGTIPTGDYANITPTVSYTAQLENGDDPAEATQELFKLARDQITEYAKPILRTKTNQIKQKLTGRQKDLAGVLDWVLTVNGTEVPQQPTKPPASKENSTHQKQSSNLDITLDEDL